MSETIPTAGMGTGAEANPIDAGALLDNCMGNAALVAMLFEKFETQARSDLDKIGASLHDGDADQTARTAHALKGAAGALSAAGVQQAAARMEHAARSKQLEASATMVADLRREVDRCLAYLPTARGAIDAKAAGLAGPGTGAAA